MVIALFVNVLHGKKMKKEEGERRWKGLLYLCLSFLIFLFFFLFSSLFIFIFCS